MKRWSWLLAAPFAIYTSSVPVNLPDTTWTLWVTKKNHCIDLRKGWQAERIILWTPDGLKNVDQVCVEVHNEK